jgi:hypothetical protein
MRSPFSLILREILAVNKRSLGGTGAHEHAWESMECSSIARRFGNSHVGYWYIDLSYRQIQADMGILYNIFDSNGQTDK